MVYTGDVDVQRPYRIHGPYTAVYGPCIRHGRYTAVYGPFSRAKTCSRAVYTAAVYGAHGTLHGRIHGPYAAAQRPSTRPWTARTQT